MRFCTHRLTYMAVRWLSRRRWGRRLIWNFMIRALRARVRRFLRDLGELLPIFEPLRAWA